MTCLHCRDAESLFNARRARKELRKYRRKGPDRPTRLLLEGLRHSDVNGASLLDIGGGIGAISHELAPKGTTEITVAEASETYIETSRAEAESRGYADRVRYEYGDFVEMAPEMPEADIVTLDRVVCCYPDMKALVRASAGKARKIYGLVFPRRRWSVRAVIAFMNLLGLGLLKRIAFRVYVHPPEEIDRRVRAEGLAPVYEARTFVWQIAVYAR